MRPIISLVRRVGCPAGSHTLERALRLATALVDVDAVDFVGRVERLTEDLAIVSERIGLGPVEAPLRNRSGKHDYRSYYSDATRLLVGEAYRTDIDTFGYSFEETTP